MDMKEAEKTFKEAFVKKFCMNEMNAAEQDEQRKLAERNRVYAQLRLICELAEGRKLGEEEGWISSEDVRKHFVIRANAK